MSYGLKLPGTDLVRIPAQSSSGSDPIVTPNVIHVTTSGNDATGDGTMAKPFITLGRAVIEADGDPCTFKLGFGTFAVTRVGWPSNQVIRGEGWGCTLVGISSTDAVAIFAHDCDISVNTNGAAGANGYHGNAESLDGTIGGSGDPASLIIIKGTCRVINATALGGAGGFGGNAYTDNETIFGNAGTGGNAGDSGAIFIQAPLVVGVINNSAAIGGLGGVDSSSLPASSGGNGTPGFLTVDGCDFHEASISSGTNAISRSRVPLGFYINNDLGGNSQVYSI